MISIGQVQMITAMTCIAHCDLNSKGEKMSWKAYAFLFVITSFIFGYILSALPFIQTTVFSAFPAAQVHFPFYVIVILGVPFFIFLVNNYGYFETQQNVINADINKIDRMGGRQFEIFIAKLFKKMGYSTEVTPESGDQGIDVIAKDGNITIGIQTKRLAGKVSNTAVQEVVAGLRFHNCDKGIVVSNNYFTQSAIDLASANNIELWDRDVLIRKLSTFNPKPVEQNKKLTLKWKPAINTLIVLLVATIIVTGINLKPLPERTLSELQESLTSTSWRRESGLIPREISFAENNHGVWRNNGGAFVWELSNRGYLRLTFESPIIRRRGNTYSYDFTITNNKLQLISRDREFLMDVPVLTYICIEN